MEPQPGIGPPPGFPVAEAAAAATAIPADAQTPSFANTPGSDNASGIGGSEPATPVRPAGYDRARSPPMRSTSPAGSDSNPRGGKRSRDSGPSQEGQGSGADAPRGFDRQQFEQWAKEKWESYTRERRDSSRDRETRSKVYLDEKYFRRVDKFDGDVSRFRGWMFDLMVAIGQVDNKLSDCLMRMLARKQQDKYNPMTDFELDKELYKNIGRNCMDCCVD